MNKFLLCAVASACIGVGSLAAAAGTAPARQARVATGAKVPLVGSSRTAEDWSARRPQFRELKPRIRGTVD